MRWRGPTMRRNVNETFAATQTRLIVWLVPLQPAVPRAILDFAGKQTFGLQQWTL